VTTTPKVDAVITAFRPTAELRAHAALVASQVRRVLVVDDGSGAGFEGVFAELETDGVQIIRSRVNGGIGSALNRGIREALDGDADYVLTMDQDSAPPAGFVAALVRAAETANALGRRVGFVVPQRFAGVDQAAGKLRDGTLRTRGAIQSGMLVPRATFEQVGMMRDDFFIDLVDTEFELRCECAGIGGIAAPGLEMPHRLGSRYRRPRLFGRFAFPPGAADLTLSEPYRYYYRARNRVVLTRLYRRRRPLRMLIDAAIDRAHFLDARTVARPRSAFDEVIRTGRRDARAGRMGRMPEGVAAAAAAVSWSAERVVD
jgi:rhamnosyltransferase